MSQFTVEEIYNTFKDMEAGRIIKKTDPFVPSSKIRPCPVCGFEGREFVARKGSVCHYKCTECFAIYTDSSIDSSECVNDKYYWKIYLSEKYRSGQNIIADEFIERIKSSRKENVSILEIGSGTGDILSRIKTAGYDVTGTDFSQTAYAIALTHHPELVDCYKYGDFLKFETDKKFDFIITNHTIEHFNDGAGVFRKISELLKPLGIVLLITPDTRFFNKQDNTWEHINTSMAGEHTILYSYPSLAKVAEINNLIIRGISGLSDNSIFMELMKGE